MSSPTQELVRELLGAVDNGNAGGVKQVLQEPGIMVNGTNKHGESPLHIAAGYGYMHITRMLLDSGANMDQKDKHGDSPLYWASRHGHVDMVKYLVAKGAMLDLQDKSEETAIHVAARYGYPEVVTFLCQSGASLDIQDKDGETALHCASWHGFLPIVEGLTHYGCALDTPNKDSETALHIAAVRGYIGIVKLLCQANADVNKQDKNGCTALHLATRRHHLDIVQYLCGISADLDLRDKLEESPLHDACRDGVLSLVQTLYAAGCKLDIANKKNKATPVHLAAKYGHIEIVRCLCAAGCNLDAVTEQGYSADEVASGAGHETTATLIHTLRTNNSRDSYVSEMAPAGSPVTKVKLLVCGGAGVGKTELVSSLRCGRLKSLFRRRAASDLSHMVSHRTYGFNVHQCLISGAGDFSVWDFSGRKNYYLGHEHFLVSSNSIFVIVFSLRDPIDRQTAQVQHWLKMIRAKQSREPVKSDRKTKPLVVLVGSFADQQLPLLEPVPSEATSNGEMFAVPSAASVFNPHVDNGQSILDAVTQEFGHIFSFPQAVHILDCRLSQTKEIRALRSLLGVAKAELLKDRHYVPKLTVSIAEQLEAWRQEHAHLPVLTWQAYHDKVRSAINPLVPDVVLRDVTNTLHEMGEVFATAEGLLRNVVILDPGWLGMRIFGPALSPENSYIPQLKSVTGRVSLQEIRRVFPLWNSLSVARLFQHFEICYPKNKDNDIFEFPCLVKMQSVFGLWEKDPVLTVYSGVRIQASTDLDMLTPGAFPLVQSRLRRAFSEDFDDQELSIWTDGLKCCRGEVEVLVSVAVPEESIDLKVRGTSESCQECYSLLHQFYVVIQEALKDALPGVDTLTHFLSVKQMREHQTDLCYHPLDVFNAARSPNARVSHPSDPSITESIVDLVCCGCEELQVAVKSVPYLSSATLLRKTRQRMGSLLDPPNPLGVDWCLFALALGLVDELPAIDRSNVSSSSTECVLQFWEKSSQSTLAKLIDSLIQIGRQDVVRVLVEGISLFPSSANSLVLKVSGSEALTYFC